MANAGEMWIELGLKDNVSEDINKLLNSFKIFNKQIEDVVNALHGMESIGKLGPTKEVLSNTKTYYDLVAKITQAERDLNNVMDARKSRKMNTDSELSYWEKLMKLRDQLKNGVPLDDKDFVNTFKLSLDNTIREMKEQVQRAKAEMNDYDKNEAKRTETRRAITAETERLAAAEERLHRLREDSQSKATIASIKEQNVEYDAQMQKVRELDALLKKVEKDRLAALRGSGTPHSSMTDAVITKEVDAIQRRYNEAVALGTKLEQDDANAKRQQKEETDQLNAKLRENQRLNDSVSKTMYDAQSQQRIAGIRNMTAEYDALQRKIVALNDLQSKIWHERATIQNDKNYAPIYTKEEVSRQLDAIQRQYNEDLARGKELERQDAEAKKQATDASRRLAEANKSLMSSYDKVTQSSRQTMSTLSMLRQQMGYYFSLFGMQTLLRDVITIGGQFEFQHVALQNIIGDAEKATAVFSQLKDLAVESPKTFMELTASAKQLSAYQIPANELFDTTKRLSDLSVGLGVDMNRLILAYGQVRSAAVLRGQELRQFTEAGIPMVQALAQKFTELNGKVTTTADVFKLIQTRAVSFEMVKEVLWDMTNQGGQFFNMQSTMADTLYGKWQKLQDIWQITLGNMADANSMSGKFFKTALDGVIFLARNLQSLIPMLGVYGLYKGSRAIKNGFFGGMSGIDSNITKAQRLNEIELRRKLLNGQIDQEMYDQAIKLNKQKSAYYELLAAEGKISDKKIAQLAIDEKINQEFAERLLLMKGYTQEQIKAAMANKGAGMAGSLSGVGRSAFNFIGGWTGVAMLGIGAVISALSTYNQRMDEIEEKAKSMATNAKERAKTLKDAYEAIADKAAPTEQSELQHQVEAMKEILKNQDLYTEAIDKSVNSATSLSEKYELLKEHIKDAANAQQLMADYSELAKQAVEDSGYFLGATADQYGNVSISSNERVDTNMTQFEGSYNKYVSYVESLGDVREKLEAEISKIGGSLGAALDGKDLEEQIRILVQSGAWDDIVARFSDTDKDLAEHLKNVGEYADDANDKWMEIVTDDVPKIVDTIKKWIPAKGEEAIRKWAQSNETIVQAMINAIARMISINAPKIRTAFINAIRGVFGLAAVGVDGNTERKGTPYELQSVANKNLLHKIVKAYGNGVSSVEEMARWIGDVNSPKTYDEAFESIKKARDAAKKTYNAAKAAKKDASKEKADYERLEKIFKGSGAASYFEAQASDKKKGKKGSSGSKTDEVAKAAKERVSVLKDAYSEYKKWAGVIGKESALNKIKESGIFGSLFADKDFKGLEDYKGELQRIKSMLSPDKAEQRKVIESIDKILLGMDYDDAKENAEKDIALIQKSMERMSRMWDTFKNVYEKTGNKENAMQLVFGNTANLRNGIESAKDYWRSMLLSVSGSLTATELEGLTDKELSERFGNTWQTVKLYRDEYMKAFRASADEEEKIYLELLEESMTFADKMAKIEAQRAKDISAAKGDKNLIYAANQRANKAISELDFDKLKDSINWDVVFGNLDTYTKDVLVKVRKQLKDYLKLNRSRMDVKELKTMGTALKNINSAVQKQSGLFGGLKDAQTELKDATNDLYSAQFEYNLALEQYGDDSKQAEDAMDKVNEAQNRVVNAQAGVKQAEQDTINNIAAITNAMTSLGKTSKASLSDVGNAVGAVMSALGKSGSKWGQLISAIFTLLDAIGNDAPGFFGNLFSGIGHGIYGINSMLNPVGNLYKTLHSDLKIFGDNWFNDRMTDMYSMYWLKPADYEEFEKAKAAYERLSSVWDTLIEKKTEYLSQSWGTEAKAAEKEAKSFLESQIRATQFVAQKALEAGDSMWSHSIQQRMWEGSYKANGQNWKDVADEAVKGMKAAGLGDVKFTGMSDMLNMTSDQLKYLMEEYSELWAAMDDDFREYMEKLIEYYEKAEELTDQLKEKLTGWNFQSLADSWAGTLSDMSKTADDMFDDFENGLREAIINGMISNIYSGEMKQLVDSMAEAAKNEMYTDIGGEAKRHTYDKNGNVLDSDVLSEYTKEEYDNLMAYGKNLAEREEASRDLLADLYGWANEKSGESSVSQVLSGLSENDQSLLMSYVNAIRGDVSVLRSLAEQETGTLTGMNATVQLQLRELEAISVNTRRNADSAEFIEMFCRGLRDGEYTIKVK